MKEMLDYLMVLFVILSSILGRTAGIQCYSCKASGSNEVDANIRCLETAYLEDCDDFYQYYNEVEDQANTQYYYYGDEGYYDGYDEEGIYDDEKGEVEEQEAPAPKDNNNYINDNNDNRARGRRKRQADDAPAEDVVKKDTEGDNDVGDRVVHNGEHGKTGYEYDYNNMEEYEYPEELAEVLTPPTSPGRTAKPSEDNENSPKATEDVHEEEGEEEGEKEDVPQPTLPKDPEHYCYSHTKKNRWESYTVEKGCKKITYCNDHYANLPEWGLPWNFCCDRSRCNAKQVKDKPQRIFGMGCRRTDDCIQGHASRPVCPHMFKSCPTISTSLIKMECRAKVRPSKAASARNPNIYFGQFQEKKCFCLPGYYPKGPICTNSASPFVHPFNSLLCWCLVCLLYLLYPQIGVVAPH